MTLAVYAVAILVTAILLVLIRGYFWPAQGWDVADTMFAMTFSFAWPLVLPMAVLVVLVAAVGWPAHWLFRAAYGKLQIAACAGHENMPSNQCLDCARDPKRSAGVVIQGRSPQRDA